MGDGEERVPESYMSCAVVRVGLVLLLELLEQRLVICTRKTTKKKERGYRYLQQNTCTSMYMYM